MELVVKDAVVTIEPKDSSNKDTIKIKPLQESTITIEFGERRIL